MLGSLDQHPSWYERHSRINDPVSLRIHSTGLFCPNNGDLSLDDVDFISYVVKKSVKG